ncbi:MAG: cytochrome P450 [Myxococcota bacterium]
MILKTLQRIVASEKWMRRLSPAMGPLNPFLPEHRADPFANWNRLREESPVFYSRAFGAWFVTRYDDCLEALAGGALSSDRSALPVMGMVRFFNRNEPEFLGFMQRNLLMLEGTEHRGLRGLVSKAFTPRRVAALRPRLEALADELLDGPAREGRMELVNDFAYPFPVTAIAELLGVPSEDRGRFHAWTSDLVQFLDPFQGSDGPEPMRRATRELYAYFRPLLAERRAEPRDDLMSAMIQAEEDGRQLNEKDLLALCVLLLAAGHETTANLIGNSVVTLLRNPDERKRLQEDDSLWPTAVNEFLRFESPIQLTDRAVQRDCEFGGRVFKKGQLVAVGLAAANRDPRQFEDPDRFDVGRTPNQHLALGHGNHFCLGSQLAKLEAEVALSALLRRFPDFSGSVDPPAWRRSMTLRGPASLPLDL